MPIKLPIVLTFLLGMTSCQQEQATPETALVRPRTIVTTDGEIDDVDSFIRMLLYANEFQLEGLVYSSSMWHYKGDGRGTRFVSEMDWTRDLYGERTALRWPGTSWMQELIDAYEQVFPRLSSHAQNFPEPDYLRSIITVGNIDFEGEMEKDTEGSNWIKAKLLDDNPTPIYLQAWGGTNTIARALKSIELEYADTKEWEDIYRKVAQKAIIYTILDQDATYQNYVAKAWPDVRIFYNASQFWCLAYPWKQAVPESWHYFMEGDFTHEHIIEDHGALTGQYYSYGDGKKQAGDPEHRHGDTSWMKQTPWGSFGTYDFISEGDSPAFLHLVDVGLDNLEHPEYGGWGGRLAQSKEQPNRWEDGAEVLDFNPFTDTLDATYPQTRWLKALQEDFAARADWCVLPYEQANHPPQVKLNHENHLQALAGSSLTLSASASDPDGDALAYQWWQYADVDSYPGTIELVHSNHSELSLELPADMQPGEHLHLIVSVRDSAEWPMTRYQRVIIECVAP